MSSSSAPTCDFCSHCQSKYTCPRCRRVYCSTTCYASKEHDSCAQTFYRNCVLEKLKSDSPHAGSEKDMVAILKRVAEESDTDPPAECSGDLVSRFKGIDFDDDSAEGTTKLLARLTAEERKEFEEMVCCGRIINLIPDEEKAEPWWINFRPKLVSDECDSQSSGLGAKRDLVNQLPPLSAISGRAASPDLKYCLMNLFISYCYTYRLFSGDHMSCPEDFLEELCLRCAVLRDGSVFRDTATALQHCAHNLISERLVSQAFVKLLFEDVKSVTSDKNAILRLFADVWFLVHQCISCATLKSKRKENKLLLKKIEYFVAWTKDQSHELVPLIHEIDLLIAESASGIREEMCADLLNKLPGTGTLM